MEHPRFCPNPDCREHRLTAPTARRWWVRDGHYRSHRAHTVQRFRCKRCGRRFSSSTFSVHYFTKKRVDLYRLHRLITNGSSVRATARQLHVSPATVTHRTMLLARQLIAAHAELTEELTPHDELVADGFQSFWVSQYHPNNFNLLVGAKSQYLFAMTQATLRRSGTMTEKQKRRRARIEAIDPPDPLSLPTAFTELMQAAGTLWTRMPEAKRVLRTDEHQAYPPALSTVELPGIRHLRISSREPRTSGNPLFSVNYLDREIRKDLAEHHRETVCFARNSAVSTARMWVYLVTHNLYKRYRISPRTSFTHAEAAGISLKRLRQVRREVHTRRAFFSRSKLNHEQRRVWLGLIPTPERENRSNRKLTPGYCSA